MRTRRHLLIAGAASTAVLLSLSTAAPALAAGEVVVTDRETVQAYLTSTGKVKVARLYDQITATGQGTVDIANPVNPDGLRNLEGLGDVEVEDGKAVTTLDVDGEDRLRTVSSFDEKDLPVTITPTYELDGKVYDDPEDLVGKSGQLTVTYRVENTTSRPTTITVQDGKGQDVEKTIDVPMPLVGSLVTVLPKGFYSVRTDQATISADGRGGQRLTYTMTLLPPIASTVAELSYTAQVEDAVIPKATVSIAVVQPLKNPSLSTAAASYQGGADTGATLTAGAEEIDANLLKLRDGAGQLLGGLIQLRDGAQQLNDGLAGEAAPGARRLADGAGEAAVGAGQLAAGLQDAKKGSGDLADGVGRIADGNGQLAEAFNSSTGAKDLVSGSQDLAAGLGLISGGLSQLAGVEGLPKAYAGLVALKGAIDTLVIPAVGTTTTPCPAADPSKQTLLGCAQTIVSGLPALQAGADQLASPSAGLPAAKGGVDLVKAGLDDALRGGGSVDALSDGLEAAYWFGGCAAPGTPLPPPPAPAAPPSPPYSSHCDYIEALFVGVEGAGGLREKTATASGGLGLVSAGLGTAIAGVGTGTNPGPTTLRGGIAQVIVGVTGLRNGLVQLRAGLTNADANGGKSNVSCNPALKPGQVGYCGITEGLSQLASGVLSAVTGVNQLSAGAKSAAEGSGDLADGIAEAGDGAQQLADGSLEAAAGSKRLADGLVAAGDGSARLADGNRQISDGAGDLADGLGDAADGSGRLAEGLGEAADGAPQLVDGAQRLSDEGTKKLVEAGNETTVEFGTNYAIIDAMAEKTKDGGLPYGAPEGATGSAAYSFELAAATNEGSKNLTRGALALVALGVGALLSTVIRARFF